MSLTNRCVDKNVSNIHAFQVLIDAFTYPHSNRRPETTGQSELPLDTRRSIFQEMKRIIQLSPINYFTLERTNVVPVLIESLESYKQDIQVKSTTLASLRKLTRSKKKRTVSWIF